MIKILLTSVITLFVSGCTMLNYEPIQSEVGIIKKSNVTWVIVEDPNKFCTVRHKIYAGPGIPILACTTWNDNDNSCIIYTDKSPGYDLLGHELRHCFDKYWHK